MKKTYTWSFPKHINLFEVHEYLHLFTKIKKHREIIFDLTETHTINSSFIGFMIHSKEQLKKLGVKYAFNLSPSVTKTLTMLGMGEYFSA